MRRPPGLLLNIELYALHRDAKLRRSDRQRQLPGDIYAATCLRYQAPGHDSVDGRHRRPWRKLRRQPQAARALDRFAADRLGPGASNVDQRVAERSGAGAQPGGGARALQRYGAPLRAADRRLSGRRSARADPAHRGDGPQTMARHQHRQFRQVVRVRGRPVPAQRQPGNRRRDAGGRHQSPRDERTNGCAAGRARAQGARPVRPVAAGARAERRRSVLRRAEHRSRPAQPGARLSRFSALDRAA